MVSWQRFFRQHLRRRLRHTKKYFQIIIDSLKYCCEHKGLYLLGFVIMLNHIHLITANEEQTNLSDIMRDFKHFTSTKIAEQLEHDNEKLYRYVFKKAAQEKGGKQDYKIWQDSFHPEAIYSDHWFNQKLEYIHHNPLRKGFVSRPEDWKFSSARNWILEDDSIIRIHREIIA